MNKQEMYALENVLRFTKQKLDKMKKTRLTYQEVWEQAVLWRDYYDIVRLLEAAKNK